MIKEIREIVAMIAAYICTLAVVLVGVWAALYLIFSPATCYAHGRKTGLTVEWGFWTACMVNIQGQWLSQDMVVPVERNGKVVFVPKPVPTVQLKP